MSKYLRGDVMYINNYRKVFTKLGIYIILLGIVVLMTLLPKVINSKKDVAQRPVRYETDLIYILFWKQAKRNKKNFFNKDMIYAEGQKSFITQECPHINCFITYNKSIIQTEENFDAIVFNIHDIQKLNIESINKRRSPNQKYIFKSLEPAQLYPICDPLFDNFFNLTWSYKLNSDVPSPFINIFNNQNNWIGPSIQTNWSTIKSTNKFKDKIKRKTKAVAWFINNCKLKNQHHDFVMKMQNILKRYNLNLDTFGLCGQKRLVKGDLSTDRYFKQIEKDYYFQLVLEDTVTQDYVTEIIAKAMMHATVPIFFGRNFSSFFPPNSYINAASYESKVFGAMIDHLIKNPDKYSHFFDWKNYYYFTPRPRLSICELCTKLNEYRNSVTSYSNFRVWWNKEYNMDECEGINMYNILNEMENDASKTIIKSLK